MVKKHNRDNNPALNGYEGNKTWAVTHPGMKPKERIVRAPNKQAAIVAAASLWKTRWQTIDFYTKATVRPYIGNS